MTPKFGRKKFQVLEGQRRLDRAPCCGLDCLPGYCLIRPCFKGLPNLTYSLKKSVVATHICWQKFIDIAKQHAHMTTITVGVLAVQGAFLEHITLLKKAATIYATRELTVIPIEVRTSQELSACDALIIPGGESTTISLVAARTDLLESLRDFVKYAIQSSHISSRADL